MQFLVTSEWVELGALLAPEDIVAVEDRAILPSLEVLAQWEDAGTIRGGVFAGERAGMMVVEAESAEQLGDVLSSLPFWGLVRWQVRPLQSFRSALERDRRLTERLRGTLPSQ